MKGKTMPKNRLIDLADYLCVDVTWFERFVPYFGYQKLRKRILEEGIFPFGVE